MMIESYAPTRIDLAGGTIDIWPICLYHEGSVTVNAGINLYAKTKIKIRRDKKLIIKSVDQKKEVKTHLKNLKDCKELSLIVEVVKFFKPQTGLEIITECEAPAHSGLGGSSSLLVALCGGLNAATQKKYSKKELLQIAYGIETKLVHTLTGKQDHIAAMHGGVNIIHYGVGGETIIKPSMSKKFFKKLNESLILCYSEEPRFSGMNNWEIAKKSIEKDATINEKLENIKTSATQMKKAILCENTKLVGEALDKEWQNRKKLTKEITTQKIEEIITTAKKSGATSAKVCGAGGGGCLIIYAGNNKKGKVENELKDRGVKVLDFKIVKKGLKVSKK